MKTLLISLLTLLSLSVSAQPTGRIVKLWSKETPSPTPQVVTEAETTDEHGFVRNIHDAELWVYPASVDVRNSGKAVILMPGGAYAGASMRWEGSEFARPLNAAGITVLVLKYRMPNGNHRIPMEDAERALKLSRDSAAVWGGYSRDKVGVMGFSAGGHLAAAISVYSDPAFAVLFYPVISSEEGKGHPYSIDMLTGGDKALKEYYSMEKHVTPQTPETLIFHGAKDNVVPLASSEAYRKALIDNGIRVTSIIFNTTDHGFGIHPRLADNAYMQRSLINWILAL